MTKKAVVKVARERIGELSFTVDDPERSRSSIRVTVRYGAEGFGEIGIMSNENMTMVTEEGKVTVGAPTRYVSFDHALTLGATLQAAVRAGREMQKFQSPRDEVEA